MVYCRDFPFTVMDFVPDVNVTVFPQPAELARLPRTFTVVIPATEDRESSAWSY